MSQVRNFGSVHKTTTWENACERHSDQDALIAYDHAMHERRITPWGMVRVLAASLADFAQKTLCSAGLASSLGGELGHEGGARVLSHLAVLLDYRRGAVVRLDVLQRVLSRQLLLHIGHRV